MVLWSMAVLSIGRSILDTMGISRVFGDLGLLVPDLGSRLQIFGLGL